MGKFGKAVSGGAHRTIYDNREHVYRALKKKYGVKKAAQIANAGNSAKGRKLMSIRAAKTRKLRGN